MNTDHSDNNEDLLGKYLAQETDAKENALIERWLQESEDNQKELNDYTFIWDRAATLQDEKEQIVNIDAAWQKVKAKIDTTESTKVVAMKPQREPRKFFTLGIAATITILLTTGILAYFFKANEPELLTLTTTDNTLQQTLPDGSVVFLNRNTSFTYPDNFDGNSREVNLTGEAFFDISRDESKPFVIHAVGSDVRVLGTSFNVKAYDKNVEVSVETGKVEFKHKKQAALLVAGEQATLEAENDTIKKQKTIDRNAFAYKSKVFIFENSELEEVVRTLSEGYHTTILINNSFIKSCRLNTRFDGESLQDALNIIAETLNLTVSTKDGQYILDGKGCRE